MTIKAFKARSVFEEAYRLRTKTELPLAPSRPSAHDKTRMHSSPIDTYGVIHLPKRKKRGVPLTFQKDRAPAADPLKEELPRPAMLLQRKKSLGCSARWCDLTGTERCRWSSQCGHFVYNFQRMSDQEILNFIWFREGIAPVSLYRRVDGMEMTADCAGASKVKSLQCLLPFAGASFAVLLIVATCFSLALDPVNETKNASQKRLGCPLPLSASKVSCRR